MTKTVWISTLLTLSLTHSIIGFADVRVSSRLDDRGDRIEQYFDRQGDHIAAYYDYHAEIARNAGKHRHAHHLDRKGDRFNHRLDHRGNRINSCLDAKSQHIHPRSQHKHHIAHR